MRQLGGREVGVARVVEQLRALAQIGFELGAIVGTATGTSLLTVTPLAKCDLIQVGFYNVTDIQHLIGQALGAMPAANDLDGDGSVNIVDVQIVSNAVLGLGCTTR